MRTFTKIILVLIVAAVAVSCRDKDAERRIAQLESRLNELEGKNGAAKATPDAAVQQPLPTDPAATAAAEPKPDGPLPVFAFEKTDHDFGPIKEGQKVAYTYKFTNTGAAPLIVQSVQPSCGCTAPDWSKEPIPVNGTGFVKVEFDSNGKVGVQNKSVTVTANTWPKTRLLKFSARVDPKPEGGPVR